MESGAKEREMYAWIFTQCKTEYATATQDVYRMNVFYYVSTVSCCMPFTVRLVSCLSIIHHFFLVSRSFLWWHIRLVRKLWNHHCMLVVVCVIISVPMYEFSALSKGTSAFESLLTTSLSPIKGSKTLMKKLFYLYLINATPACYICLTFRASITSLIIFLYLTYTVIFPKMFWKEFMIRHFWGPSSQRFSFNYLKWFPLRSHETAFPQFYGMSQEIVIM